MAAGRALPLTRIVCGFADGARFKMGASFRLPLSNCTGCGRDARDPSEAIPVRRPPNLGCIPHMMAFDRVRVAC